VTLCLAGYAWLAFADGDPERAAEGLHLVAQVRQRLGAARFDQVFAAGSGLSRQQAVAIVRDQRGTGTPAPPADDGSRSRQGTRRGWG
jgi:hypothetical protein